MTVRILEDIDRLPMTDVNDIRSFKAGEMHDLTVEHEQHLIDMGVAEPVEVIQATIETVDGGLVHTDLPEMEETTAHDLREAPAAVALAIAE